MSVASIYDISNMRPVFTKLGNDFTSQPNSGMYLEIFKYIMDVLISTVKPITFNLFDYFLDKLCSKFITLRINLPILFIFLGINFSISIPSWTHETGPCWLGTVVSATQIIIIIRP